MNADERRSELDSLTEHIIRLAYKVSNGIGCGFPEKVYQNALVYELKRHGHEVVFQAKFPVRYDGIVVGEFFADVVVDGKVILELKCVEAFNSEHEAQCMNYLRASGLSVCLLLNFAHPKVGVKRIVMNY